MAYDLIMETSPAPPAAGDKPTRSAAYRLKGHATAPESPDAKTLFEVFERSVVMYGDKPCLGHRPTDKDGKAGPYTFMTYKETGEKVKAFAASLKSAGLTKGSRVAVFGANSCEWMIAMQACNRMSFECVPLYDTLGENAIEYIINHSESDYVVVAGTKLPALVAALPKITQPLKGICYWGTAPLEATSIEGHTVTSFEEAVVAGATRDAPPDPPAPGDRCTIMYTSGTTGDPKGVMLTHSAVVAVVIGLRTFMEENSLPVTTEDSMLSYLPLAHIFDRTAEEMFLSIGGRIGYWQGKLDALVADIGALKPTIFIGVPRVFDRITNGIHDKMAGAGCLKKLLFNMGFKSKLGKLKKGFPSQSSAPFWDKILFSKFKAALGGSVRAIVSGGAPLAPHVEEFLKVTMCAPVVQGYGLTETCAASLIAQPDVIAQAGTVGPPLPNTEFCLESVPDMKRDALAAVPSGELLIRGPGTFSGYFKADDKTAEVLEADGWFHTGDVAELQPDGAVKIVDRKKNIFKLSQGEYVAVEKIESEFKKCSYVNQIWVYGNSFENSLVAVVVPKEGPLREGVKASSDTSFSALCAMPEAKQFMLEALAEQAKLSKLRGFEFVKNAHLDSEEFSVDKEMMTPTFKLKRPQLQEHYQSEIDAMYASLKR